MLKNWFNLIELFMVFTTVFFFFFFFDRILTKKWESKWRYLPGGIVLLLFYMGARFFLDKHLPYMAVAIVCFLGGLAVLQCYYQEEINKKMFALLWYCEILLLCQVSISVIKIHFGAGWSEEEDRISLWMLYCIVGYMIAGGVTWILEQFAKLCRRKRLSEKKCPVSFLIIGASIYLTTTVFIKEGSIFEQPMSIKWGFIGGLVLLFVLLFYIGRYLDTYVDKKLSERWISSDLRKARRGYKKILELGNYTEATIQRGEESLKRLQRYLESIGEEVDEVDYIKLRKQCLERMRPKSITGCYAIDLIVDSKLQEASYFRVPVTFEGKMEENMPFEIGELATLFGETLGIAINEAAKVDPYQARYVHCKIEWDKPILRIWVKASRTLDRKDWIRMLSNPDIGNIREIAGRNYGHMQLETPDEEIGMYVALQ